MVKVVVASRPRVPRTSSLAESSPPPCSGFDWCGYRVLWGARLACQALSPCLKPGRWSTDLPWTSCTHANRTMGLLSSALLGVALGILLIGRYSSLPANEADLVPIQNLPAHAFVLLPCCKCGPCGSRTADTAPVQEGP